MSEFIDDQEIDKLSERERKVLRKLLDESHDDGRPMSYGHLLNQVYSEIPVGPWEFIESKKYLNLKENIYNRIKYIFAEADPPDVNEVWLCMGRGGGKSSISSLMAARAMYRLYCLKNPQKYYNLIPGTDISCINLSVGEKQAKNVVFKAIREVVSRSPWFQGKYDSPILGQEIKFSAKNIVAYSGHSGSAAWLGYNTLIGILDEADKFVDKNEQSVAQQLYATLKGALETRWERDWKIVVISSPDSSTGFLMSHIDKMREDAVYLDPYKWTKSTEDAAPVAE